MVGAQAGWPSWILEPEEWYELLFSFYLFSASLSFALPLPSIALPFTPLPPFSLSDFSCMVASVSVTVCDAAWFLNTEV